MTKGYHVTSYKKLERYEKTGGILPPVRFWPNLETAQRWKRRTSRPVILEIIFEDQHHPLPDHRPARFTDAFVTEFEKIEG